MAELARLIDQYLAFVMASDPIEASRLGVHDHDHRLGEINPDALSETANRRRDFLARLRALPPDGLSPDGVMDRQIALTDLETALRRHDDLRPWQRAPYWYPERLGSACADLMGRGFAPVSERGRTLAANGYVGYGAMTYGLAM